MRVCVLGSSHAACLKNGWDRIQDEYPDFELRFFAARGKKIGQLQVDGTRLVPANERLRKMIRHTSGGLDEVDPAEADLFLFAGLGVRLHVNDGPFYSESVQRLAREDALRESIALSLLTKIRPLSQAPAFLMHTPLPAGGPHAHEPVSEYLDTVTWLNGQFLESLDAEILPQPSSTLDSGFRTRPEFSVGSVRLDIGDKRSGELHPDQDNRHMNADFGERFLRALFDRVSGNAVGCASLSGGVR